MCTQVGQFAALLHAIRCNVWAKERGVIVLSDSLKHLQQGDWWLNCLNLKLNARSDCLNQTLHYWNQNFFERLTPVQKLVLDQ